MLASDPPEAVVTRRAATVAFTLGTLFFGYAFIQRVSPSVMTNELMRDFSVGGAALGSLSAFYFYAYASIQLPVGMLTDRFGPRKLMSVAAALCALASLGFAFSYSLLAASVGRALIGGTVAFAFVGTLAIAGYAICDARGRFTNRRHDGRNFRSGAAAPTGRVDRLARNHGCTGRGCAVALGIDIHVGAAPLASTGQYQTAQ